MKKAPSINPPVKSGVNISPWNNPFPAGSPPKIQESNANEEMYTTGMCQVITPITIKKIPPMMSSNAETSPIQPPWLPKKPSIAYGEIPSFSLKAEANGETGTLTEESTLSILPLAPPTNAVLLAESIVALDTVSTLDFVAMNDDTSLASTLLIKS